MGRLSSLAAVVAASLSAATAQTFQRLGTCPDLGCVLPPDQSDFLPGQYFDLRLEVHAPVNGSEAFNDGVPDEGFSVTIAKEGGEARSVAEFFAVDEPELETWDFKWYEDLFAKDAETPSVVNVASKIYRRIAIYEPGNYVVTLTYYDGQTTTANWVVRPLATQKKAKNVILFIGDGMTTNMITAARLLGHKSINGKYQSLLQMDQFPVLGHQMTHSIDSFITDSANSASALYTGHKSTVNAMGVYVDSSADSFDDPKVETLVEILKRTWDSAWGAVSTAAISDATPIALTGHSRSRYAYGSLVDQGLNSVTNYSWTNHGGPDVWFGGGAEQFNPGSGSYEGKDYYEAFANAGYDISLNKTSLLELGNSSKALGIFCKSHFPVWLDRNVFTDNLATFENDPLGSESPALDLPGLKEMTLKAIDILHTRGGDKGFFLMSEGASIDKQMHALDYDRALGDLLELDDTVRATVAHLKAIGELESTLVLVTADHGHGFDVYGGVDTQYLSSQRSDRDKRRAVGTYEMSGLSQYTVAVDGVSYGTGPNFPVNWDPRYALAQGFSANPDRREDFRVHKSPRKAVSSTPGFDKADMFVDAKDSPDGFVVNGTLSVTESSGVHSLTDVAVFAMGPCQEMFSGVYGNVDVFYKMASCLGLARPDDKTPADPGNGCGSKH
ncbi:alkaline phosphatase-like protein [Annulohypoxylon truncatum]|uniref:alkaline phosphatase-like protein n=1 Tax=Annulohypoxylon truncatum TaxID=327061 RepID=UPI002008784D|nr:alkaline phosphatase-like protein [Annulohypoxylon truncatum]KAI1214701.1 alkaline phosphatase-like protein [Annulohypoxylon truncatum]